MHSGGYHCSTRTDTHRERKRERRRRVIAVRAFRDGIRSSLCFFGAFLVSPNSIVHWVVSNTLSETSSGKGFTKASKGTQNRLTEASQSLLSIRLCSSSSSSSFLFFLFSPLFLFSSLRTEKLVVFPFSLLFSRKARALWRAVARGAA